jgi:hypothetical protein
MRLECIVVVQAMFASNGAHCCVGILRPTLLPSRCHTVHYQLNDHETSSRKQTRLRFLSTFFLDK